MVKPRTRKGIVTRDQIRAHDEPECVSIMLDRLILCQYHKTAKALVVRFTDASVKKIFDEGPTWYRSESAIVDRLVDGLNAGAPKIR